MTRESAHFTKAKWTNYLGLRGSQKSDKTVGVFESRHARIQNGMRYVEVTTYEREYLGRDALGHNQFGKLVLGTTKTDVHTYQYVGASQLDKGVEGLMRTFRLTGISDKTIAEINEKWYSLSNAEKSRAMNTYRNLTIDKDYGSSGLDLSATMSPEDDDYYANALLSAIKNELGELEE